MLTINVSRYNGLEVDAGSGTRTGCTRSRWFPQKRPVTLGYRESISRGGVLVPRFRATFRPPTILFSRVGKMVEMVPPLHSYNRPTVEGRRSPYINLRELTTLRRIPMATVIAELFLRNDRGFFGGSNKRTETQLLLVPRSLLELYEDHCA